MVSHHFGKLDLDPDPDQSEQHDPHKSQKLNPYPHLDPHQSQNTSAVKAHTEPWSAVVAHKCRRGAPMEAWSQIRNHFDED